MRTHHKITAAALPLTCLLLLAACGSSSSSSSASSATTAASGGATTAAAAAAGATTTAAAAGGAGSLKGVCPDQIVLQTDWNPEAEHGHLYQMIRKGYTVNADKKSVVAPLLDSKGNDTGVTFEVRSGGPAIGFQTVSAQMYTDDKITLGYVYTDEAVQFSKDQPVVGVFAPFDINPQMIMWDPASYPDVTSIADLGKKNVTVQYFGGGAYMEDYLIPTGVLKKEQTDGGYDGTPAKFVASGGKLAQQGFASAEPFIYKNEVKEWGKDVKFQLIHDTGYPIYAESVSVRAADKAKLTPCLKLLVPIMQQAAVDYLKDPAETNKMIIDLVGKYNNGWVYTQGVADFAVGQMKKLGLMGNGTDKTLGNYEEARIQKVIDIVVPALKTQGKATKDGLKPADLITNEFVDTSIGLPA